MDIKDIPLPSCVNVETIYEAYVNCMLNGRHLSNQDLRREVGLPFLGSGFFSSVFKHPTNPDLVIKVSVKGNTDGWLEFAKYVDENPSPVFPKIGKVHTYKHVYAVVMERLEKWEYIDNCHGLFPPSVDGQRSRDWELLLSNIGYVARKKVTSVRDYPRMLLTLGRQRGCDLAMLRKHRVYLRDGIKCLVHFHNSSCHLDLHEGNVMYRSNGEIVITDPIS